MTAVLYKPAINPAQLAPASVRSLEQLVDLVQRYLGCEAAVVSFLGEAAPNGAASLRMGASIASADHQDLCALAHPLAAAGLGMRFYAGLPLRDCQGEAIGMLAAMDSEERVLASDELEMLRRLARVAVDIHAVWSDGRAS